MSLTWATMALLVMLAIGANARILCDDVEVCPNGLRPDFRSCDCPVGCGFVCPDGSEPSPNGCECFEFDCAAIPMACPDGTMANSACSCDGHESVPSIPPAAPADAEIAIDYYGNDIPGSPFSVSSSQECANLCSSVAECSFYTFDTCGGHSCWLKTSNAGRTSDSCKLSGRAAQNVVPPPPLPPSGAPPPPPPEQNSLNGFETSVDYYGFDLAGSPYQTTSADQCASLCRSTAGCNVFTFDSCGGANCWLKTSDAGRLADACRISGRVATALGVPPPEVAPPPPAYVPPVVAPPSSPGLDVGFGYWGFDIAGNPFSESTAEGCAQMCAFVPQCTHWSWDTCGQSNCWLKTSNADRRADACSISGRSPSNNGVSFAEVDGSKNTNTLSTHVVILIVAAAIIASSLVIIVVVVLVRRRQARADVPPTQYNVMS